MKRIPTLVSENPVCRKPSFREWKVSDSWVNKAGVHLRLRISATAHDPLRA